MTDCRWAGNNQPRTITNRHLDDCEGTTCPGCIPCTEPHCRVCSTRHDNGTCPECLATTREDLHDIGRMTNALPEEVEHRGIDGEAMVLLGPVADPEARGHLEASVAVGRVPAHYLDEVTDERHPGFVLTGWMMVWLDALDHEATADDLTDTIDYLDRQLAYMGGYPFVSFEDFAKDVRKCRAHLESVLHDGTQVDRGAPCPECENHGRNPRPLVRHYGARVDGAGDSWRCPSSMCDRVMSLADHDRHVYLTYLDNAEALTAKQVRARYRVPEGTLRRWANGWTDSNGDRREPVVRKCGFDGDRHQLYNVADVKSMRDFTQADDVA